MQEKGDAIFRSLILIFYIVFLQKFCRRTLWMAPLLKVVRIRGRLHSRATQTNKKVKKGQQEILTRLTNAKARVFGNWKL